MVGIHLDLKYLMPRKSYLSEWVRRLPQFGINTLLLEYEDRFPFGKYRFLRSSEGFTEEELRAFLAAARGAGLRVIPLVQSLSHLEFALAHKELAHLRELPHILTQIDPSNPAAVAFVGELMDEVLAFHEEDEFFHVGADEAWHLGRNPENAGKLRELGAVGLWMDHVRKIAARMIARGKRPMVWDDIFWKSPETFASAGLPKEAVLVSWNYVVRKLKEDGSSLRHVDVYRQAGYEVVGAPCHDWGVLVPMHRHCLENTMAWAQKARQAGMLGLLNTAWACFHTLLPTETLYAAATAEALRQPTGEVSRAWQLQFLEREFGAEPEGLPEALEDLSANWEQAVPGLERPLTPILYNYMDLVLHFDSFAQRQAVGVYPPEWGQVDFVEVYRKKMRKLREASTRGEFPAKLEELRGKYERARARLTKLAREATVRKEEARLLSFFADLKALHVPVVECLVLGKGSAQDCLEGLAQLQPKLDSALRPFVEEPTLHKLRRIWWEPALGALSSPL